MAKTIGLEITKIWEDGDLIELLFRASNGGYSAESQLYAGWEVLSNLEHTLRGFPSSPSSVIANSFGSKESDGFLEMTFRCSNTAGRTILELTINEGPRSRGLSGIVSGATLAFVFEPNALDNFVAELKQMVSEKSGTARLIGTSH